MFKNLAYTYCSVGLWLYGGTAVSQSENFKRDLKAASEYFFYLNRPSLVEPAGSLGSIGMRVGFAAHRHEESGFNPLVAHSMQHSAEQTSEPTVSPRLHLMHGTPWPVDVGVTLGSFENSPAKQIAGYAQLTILEELNIPAVSIRSFYGQLIDLQQTQINSYGCDVVAGMGFLRYFNIFGGAGYSWHRGVFAIDEYAHYGLESSSQQNAQWEIQKQQVNGLFGLRIHVSPTSHAVFEYLRVSAEQTSLAMKLGLLL